MRQRSDSDCRCGGTAPCRSPRRYTRIPGIERAAVEYVRGEKASAEWRHVGATDSDRAGLAPVCDRRIVELRDTILKGHDPVGRSEERRVGKGWSSLREAD